MGRKLPEGIILKANFLGDYDQFENFINLNWWIPILILPNRSFFSEQMIWSTVPLESEEHILVSDVKKSPWYPFMRSSLWWIVLLGEICWCNFIVMYEFVVRLMSTERFSKVKTCRREIFLILSYLNGLRLLSLLRTIASLGPINLQLNLPYV